MIRRPPRSTQSRSSAASDVYKRQLLNYEYRNKYDSGNSNQGEHAMEETGRKITKVLVIDDDKLIANIVRITLEQLDGFEALSASSGKEGVELAVSYTHLRAH